MPTQAVKIAEKNQMKERHFQLYVECDSSVYVYMYVGVYI